MFTRKSNLSLGSCRACQAVTISDTDVTRLPEASWRTWTTPRKVPFFADTLHFTYPFPILALLLIISVGFSKTFGILWTVWRLLTHVDSIYVS